MATSAVDKSINWQVPSVDDGEINVEDYRAMIVNGLKNINE